MAVCDHHLFNNKQADNSHNKKKHYHVFWVNKGIIDCQEVQSTLDANTAYNPTNSTKSTNSF